MALDTTFGLLSVPPNSFDIADDFGSLIQTAVPSWPREWAIRFVGGGFELLDGTVGILAHADRLATLFDGRLLVSRGPSPAALAVALQRLAQSGGNVYDQLEHAGFTVVAPKGDTTLDGGSFATVQLLQLGEAVVVRKRVEGVLNDDRDSGRRLISEGDWLRCLPDRSRVMFPAMVAVGERRKGGYDSRFAHGYTVSERLFHGSLTSMAGAGVLTRVLADLRALLYEGGKTAGPMVVDSYAHRIHRRLVRLAEAVGSDDGNRIHALMSAEAPVINGVRCVGLHSLLGAQTRERWVEQFDARFRIEPSHGDLILDDIVWDASAQRPFLVDPSGVGTSRIYDIGKLALSLSSYYEFFKYDQFDLSIVPSRKGLVVDIGVRCGDVRRRYDAIARMLPDILHVTGVTGRNCQISGPDLLLLNGLQNLALPMFHFIRHRNERRALVFLALGILRLNQYAMVRDQHSAPSFADVMSRTAHDTGISTVAA